MGHPWSGTAGIWNSGKEKKKRRAIRVLSVPCKDSGSASVPFSSDGLKYMTRHSTATRQDTLALKGRVKSDAPPAPLPSQWYSGAPGLDAGPVLRLESDAAVHVEDPP